MRAQGGPQKLRFTILTCSSEDADGPVRELLFHSPQTRGWVCSRFPTYPQEIFVKLEHPSKVQQIQILSHEYKIASKVEVFVSAEAAGGSTPAYKRLGYISFDSNEKSNYQARELKSVHVNVHASVLRMVIHKGHVNKLNIYNQVGIVALNLIGEPIGSGPDLPPGGYLQLHPPVTREVLYYNSAAADIADLNLDIHVDTVTAAKIRELARGKDAAVAREDYDEAKRIKAGIDRLKVVGQKIAQLEARKRAAVEKEDYDTAKLIKVDIDKLRATGESAAGAVEALASRHKDPGEIFGRVMRASRNGPMTPASTAGVTMSTAAAEADGQSVSRGNSHIGGDASMLEDQSLAPIGETSAYNDYNPQSSLQMGSGKNLNYDDRPALGKGRYTPTGVSDPTAGLEGTEPPSATPAIDYECDIPAPDGWPKDLPGPEPMAGKDAKDAESLEDLAGEYVARAMFSRNWQLREAAINYLGHLAQGGSSGGLGDKKDAFRTLSKTVQRAMKDKVANVFLASINLFQSLMGGMGASTGGNAVQGACDNCLPLLLEKLGDSNPKLSSAAKDGIMFMSGLKEADLKASTHLLLKPVKNQSAFRPVLGVLNILQDLIPVLGIDRSNGGGFDLPELMEWVGKCFSSPNGDVRSAAIRVTKEAYDLVGPAVRKHLHLSDINAKIKEQLDGILGAEPAAAAPSRAAPVKAKTASAPAAKKAPAAAAAAKKQQPLAAGAASIPPAAASGDDPAPYLEELAQRESQHGADHPRVAETASNLAILYNQRGDVAAALPLYERALAIYEKAYGPDHPDVAHTLTDLAVLHLEQGNETTGRPLLERALIIQESALGPDHPDVIAIKDVLNSAQ